MNSMNKKIFLSILAGILLSFAARAQDTLSKAPVPDTLAKLLVSSVKIAGNKKTKNYIILREMQVKTGDSIPASSIYQLLEQSRFLIYNTNLFDEVSVYPVLINGSEVSIFVIVRERWYIYPAPQFKLVDRNINEWINEQNASLKRVTYGLKFIHYNFSGRADQLRLTILNGFNRALSASYTSPYSNRALTEGFSVFGMLTQSREVQYKTSYQNQLMRFNNGNFVRDEHMLRGTYQIRRGYFRRHIITGGLWYFSVSDSINKENYNPQFLNNGKSSALFPFFGYTYQYINVDNINYPLKGVTITASILKKGLKFKGGVNHTRIDAHLNKFTPYGKNWFGSYQFMATVKAPFRTAYINQRAIGYEDFLMRGLENYVIDGYAAFIGKYTVAKKVVSFKIPIPWKFKAIPSIPFTFYAKTYADLGYSAITREFDTRLNNRVLYSGGFGIDMVTLYDVTLKFEYSFNQLGEKGLFLRTKTNL